MRLLKYSYCKFCGSPIRYSGRGRPVIICDECKETPPRILTCKDCGITFTYCGIGRPCLYCDNCRKTLAENRRLYMVNYMDKYRKKRKNMIYGTPI